MSQGRIPGPAGLWPAGHEGGWMGNRIHSERLCLRQLEADEAFVRAVDNGADPGAYGVYQLVRSSDAMVVGDIGFHGPPNPGGSVTVGYGLAPGARGRGYATEALRAVVAWALAQPEVVAVEADTTHANLPSQRVMERAGMRLYDKSDQLRFYRVP